MTTVTMRFAFTAALACCAGVSAADLSFDFEDGQLGKWVAVDEKDLGDPGPSKWVVQKGPIAGNALMQTSNIWGDATDTVPIGTFCIYDGAEFGNFVLDVDVVAGDNDGMGVVWAYTGPEVHYRVFMMVDGGNPPNGDKGPWRKMEKRLGKGAGSKLPFYADKPMTIQREPYAQGAILHWTLEVKNGQFRFLMDQKEILKAADDAYKVGKIGFQLYAQNNVAFDNVKVKDMGLPVSPRGRTATLWGRLRSARP
jgi:hypothetical protein